MLLIGGIGGQVWVVFAHGFSLEIDFVSVVHESVEDGIGESGFADVVMQVKYLNNVVEADHGKLKLLIRPVRGFKTLKTAYATIKGFEVMRALRKGQARVFALQDGIVGEARIVERAFGVGPCALSEAIVWLQDHLASAKT